ncbi:MAG: diadenylate cyclase [Clostridia bacterium]|nr:diadenylate cyclase [Clostridia bacterium]MDN5375627.1 diadenylate cyclase [Thermacetogenium sp.]
MKEERFQLLEEDVAVLDERPKEEKAPKGKGQKEAPAREVKEEKPDKKEPREEKKEPIDEKGDGLTGPLKMVAPGTALREGLDSVLRAKTGALIVVGDAPEVLRFVEGGFHIDTDFTPAGLYELAKMDGAIVLSRDARRILYANAQLIPDPSIPSEETGIRHRTAERFARQTGALVIAISQRRGVITLYKGAERYSLQDISVILSKANQAVQTLEKYKGVLDKALINLTALEFEDLVTVYDVARVVQRGVMVLQVVKELENYICELGTEGRLITMQVEELLANVREELCCVIRDYLDDEGKNAEDVLRVVSSWPPDDLLDLTGISRILGYGASSSILDLSVYPRGYRILQRIPRLPAQIVENLIRTFKNLQNILKASIEELDDVEGIGEVRAKAIKNGLHRLQEQVMLERYMG